MKISKDSNVQHEQNDQNLINFDGFDDVWYVNFFTFSHVFFNVFYQGYSTKNMYILVTFFLPYKSEI